MLYVLAAMTFLAMFGAVFFVIQGADCRGRERSANFALACGCLLLALGFGYAAEWRYMALQQRGQNVSAAGR